MIFYLLITLPPPQPDVYFHYSNAALSFTNHLKYLTWVLRTYFSTSLTTAPSDIQHNWLIFPHSHPNPYSVV